MEQHKKEEGEDLRRGTWDILAVKSLGKGF